MAAVPVRKQRAPVWLLVRRMQLQKIVRRRRVPNTHACCAPKRVAVRVNGGLGRRGDRRESVGDHVERKGARCVGITGVKREMTGLDSG
jgi:hypothetical protein